MGRRQILRAGLLRLMPPDFKTGLEIEMDSPVTAYVEAY